MTQPEEEKKMGVELLRIYYLSYTACTYIVIVPTSLCRISDDWAVKRSSRQKDIIAGGEERRKHSTAQQAGYEVQHTTVTGTDPVTRYPNLSNLMGNGM